MSGRKRWRANFFDKNGDETRSLTVVAPTEEKAEEIAEKEADRRKWPSSFKLADVEELHNEV